MPLRQLAVLAAVSLLHWASADVYMHAPRGSNDRNCEKNVNRNNGALRSGVRPRAIGTGSGDRLFDSQNNAKGGCAPSSSAASEPRTHRYACPRPRVGPRPPAADAANKM